MNPLFFTNCIASVTWDRVGKILIPWLYTSFRYISTYLQQNLAEGPVNLFLCQEDIWQSSKPFKSFLREIFLFFKKLGYSCFIMLYNKVYHYSGVLLTSVAQSCPTLCDPMDCSMAGLPVHHQLLELTQTHVNRISDDIQPSHPLLSGNI